MKVVLIALNAKYVHTNLAVRYLKHFTQDLDYQCTIKEFSINDRLENILENILKEKPDVIGFSCYIWNIDMVEKLSRLIKRVNENIEILYGGPEVSYDSKEFLQSNEGDYVIEGEGEETFREFLQYKLGQRVLEGIRGLWYKDSKGQINTPLHRNLIDINQLIFPYRDEDNFKNKIIYYEASRGCPFRCKYCLSSTIDGVRFRDIEVVKSELSILMKREISLVKFVDRTFNANRGYAREIWNFLKEQDTDTCFHFEISADLLTDEDIEILVSAPKGRFQFEIGVQTTNEKVIRNIDRTMNLEKLADNVKKLKAADNIKLHLDLIAGLPEEDFNSFKKSFNEVYSMGPHEIQLGFLKLLKGSLMREEEEKWEMVYSPYPPYEILKNKDISYEELLVLKKIEEMVDKYYNSGNFHNILNYLIPDFETAFDFFHKLSEFFDSEGYFDRNISGVEYYRIFIDFNEKFIRKDSAVLKDIIKYDYLSSNKKNWIPDFLDRKISKEEEKKIKQILIDKYNITTTKGVYIEGYDIDIDRFVGDNAIFKRKCYLVYGNEKTPVKTIYFLGI
ncbi:B12-binding domain-containing radical SAM protein [Clostridium thermarum]|uniref:B12-binding domain-containing radical SAM protein n=1 Tax=Clostridium thermarum TaxID=1716543 RepID=UPI0013D7A345|nr:B12-binding domain-containing radical SAM protein [Clostridium thermarum]